jgi:hypothetical protein
MSRDKQLGLASPLECAAIQSGQDQNPLRREKGLDANHHIHVSPGGRIFFLTSFLIGSLTDLPTDRLVAFRSKFTKHFQQSE